MPRAEELIKRDVVDQLAWDTRVNANEIQVEVNDSTVTLNGSVPSYRARLAAQNDARNVLGVSGVENQLIIEYPTTFSVPTDNDIQVNAKNVLIWDPTIDASNITVTVDNGWVTLEGTVDMLWKKIEAESRVSNVAGVLGITNKLTVVPTENLTDQLIAEDIENALDRDVLIKVDDIDVKVEDGIVTLYGTVPSWTIDQLAYNAALYTNGVLDVRDNLVVSP